MSLLEEHGNSHHLMLQNSGLQSRKRKITDTPISEGQDSKKRKVDVEPEEPFTPAFWDSLSKIHLTKLALKELNRRNTEATLPQPTKSLKRKRSHLIPAGDYLQTCDEDRVREIKRTARHGGPDLSDTKHPFEIPYVPHTFMAPQSNATPSVRRSRTKPTAASPEQPEQPEQTTTTGQSSGPYNTDFRQKIIDEGIYPCDYVASNGQAPSKASNWQELKQRLIKPRRSLSPSKFSEEHFERFERATDRVHNESHVRHLLFSTIEGKIDDDVWTGGGTRFNNYDRLIPTAPLMANPDIYFGAHPTDIDRRVRDELNHLIIPATSKDLPAAPNFFVELKGPKGSTEVAELQACHYAALGARGIRSLQEYAQGQAINDEKAYTLSATFCNRSILTVYATHAVEPDTTGSQPKYIMHKLRSFDLVNDPETFRLGATYYRNARDLAKDMRDEAISKANEKAHGATRATDADRRESSSSAGGLMLDGAPSPKPHGEESETLPTDQSNTTAVSLESEASSLQPELQGPTKRPLGHTRGASQPTLKKINTGESEEVESS